jgi:hypothetical protein
LGNVLPSNDKVVESLVTVIIVCCYPAVVVGAPVIGAIGLLVVEVVGRSAALLVAEMLLAHKYFL